MHFHMFTSMFSSRLSICEHAYMHTYTRTHPLLNDYIVPAAWYGFCLCASRVRFGMASIQYRASLDVMSAVMYACEFTSPAFVTSSYLSNVLIRIHACSHMHLMLNHTFNDPWCFTHTLTWHALQGGMSQLHTVRKWHHCVCFSLHVTCHACTSC